MRKIISLACKLAQHLEVIKGQISDVPISKNLRKGISNLCTKFHAFIIKSTIFSPICSTISDVVIASVHSEKKNLKKMITIIIFIRMNKSQELTVFGRR